jgi:hypothetical protein
MENISLTVAKDEIQLSYAICMHLENDQVEKLEELPHYSAQFNVSFTLEI